MRQHIATTDSQVNQWTLLAETQTGRDGQHHADRLDEKGPLAEISTNNESTEYRFDLCLAKKANNHLHALIHYHHNYLSQNHTRITRLDKYSK